MVCIYCIGGWHQFCAEPTDKCCCQKTEEEFLEPKEVRGPKFKREELELPTEEYKTVTYKRPVAYGKNWHPELHVPQEKVILEKQYKDPESTGRKRAVLLAQVEDGEPCAWGGLANAGGGAIPIVGCRPRSAAAIDVHHGPDKSTMNNSPENLHKICKTCHNRWHTENDPFYPKVRPLSGPYLPVGKECLPHDAVTLATEEDYADSDLRWTRQRPRRAPAS